MLLGTQAIGGRYQFTQDEPLMESAKLIAELGSGIMKFSISKQASFGKTKAILAVPACLGCPLKAYSALKSCGAALRCFMEMVPLAGSSTC